MSKKDATGATAGDAWAALTAFASLLDLSGSLTKQNVAHAPNRASRASTKTGLRSDSRTLRKEAAVVWRDELVRTRRSVER